MSSWDVLVWLSSGLTVQIIHMIERAVPSFKNECLLKVRRTGRFVSFFFIRCVASDHKLTKYYLSILIIRNTWKCLANIESHSSKKDNSVSSIQYSFNIARGTEEIPVAISFRKKTESSKYLHTHTNWEVHGFFLS